MTGTGIEAAGMSLQALQQTLQTQANNNHNVITLNDATLGTTGVDTLARQALNMGANDFIQVTVSGPIPAPGASSLVITAATTTLTGLGVSTPLTVSLTFRNPSGSIIFDMVLGGLPSNWTFGTTFPDLQSPLFHNLPVTQPGFLFSSYDHNGNTYTGDPDPTATPGLNFLATVGVSNQSGAVYQLVAQLLNQTSLSVPITGPTTFTPVQVQLESGTQTITGTNAALEATVSLTGTSLSFLPLTSVFVGAKSTYVTSGSNQSLALDDDTPTTTQRLAVTFGGTTAIFGSPVVLEADIQYQSSAVVLEVFAEQPNTSIISLNSLLSFLGAGTQNNDWQSQIPSSFTGALSFGLKSASMLFRYSNGTVSVGAVSAAMGITQPWPVIQNNAIIPDLTVNTLDLAWQVIDPAGVRALSASVNGQLEFSNSARTSSYIFDISVAFDSGETTVVATYEGTFSLAVGDINGVFLNNQVQLPTGGTFLDLKFSQPAVTIKTTAKTLQFTSGLTTQFNIYGEQAFAISGGNLDITLGGTPSVQASFNGTIYIARFAFDVSTTISNNAFVFNGALQTNTPVDIMQFVGRLLPSGSTLPSWAPQSVDLTQLAVSLDTGTGKFSLDAAIAATWSITIFNKPLSLSVSTHFEADKPPSGGNRQYSGKITGTLVVGMTFTVTYQFGADTNKLTASWTAPDSSTSFDYQSAASDMGVNTSVVTTLPSGIPNLGLKSLSLTIDFKNNQALFIGQSTNYGSGFFDVQKDPVSGWGFVAGLAITGADWNIGSIAGLEALQGFSLSTIVVAVSSLASTTFTLPIQVPAGLTTINKGFNFYAVFDWSNQPSLQTALGSFLKAPGTISLYASVYLNNGLQAQFIAKIDCQITLSQYVTFDDVQLMFQVNSGVVSFSLKIDLTAHISGQDILFNGMATLDEGGFTVLLDMPGTWNNALGIQDLTVSEAALLLGVDDDGIPSFGIFGQIDYKGFEGSLDVYFDSTTGAFMLAGSVTDFTLGALINLLDDGVSVPADIEATLNKFSITGLAAFNMPNATTGDVSALNANTVPTDLAAAFSTNGHTLPTDPKQILVYVSSPGTRWFITDQVQAEHYTVTFANNSFAVELDAQLYISPTGFKPLNLPAGYRADGTITIPLPLLSQPLTATVFANVSTSQGIDATVNLSPITLGDNLLVISGADGDPGPILSLATYSDPSNPTPAFRSPHFLISGEIQLLGGLITEIAYLSIQSSGFAFDFETSISGFTTEFAGSISSSGFTVSADMSFQFNGISLPGLSQGGTTIIPAIPATDLSLDVGVVLSSNSPVFELHCQFELFGLDLHFDVQPPQSVVKDIQNFLNTFLQDAENAATIFGDFLGDSGFEKWAASVLGGALSGLMSSQQLADAMAFFKQDALEAAQLLKALGYTFDVIKDVMAGNWGDVTQLLNQLFGFQVTYAGLGQYIGPQTLPATADFDTIETWMQGTAAKAIQTGAYSTLYSPGAGWLVCLDTQFLAVLHVGAVFYDPTLYSLKVEVKFTLTQPNIDWILEITYHKLSGDLGVYLIETSPPYGWGQQQFGPVKFNIPKLQVSVWTNGDFLVNVGFPYNNDWSQSLQVTALPFKGSGGFYFGKLSSAISNLFAGATYNMILAAGIGIQLGYSNSLNIGILSGGLSVLFTGIIEGAVGANTPPTDTSTTNYLQSPAGLYLAGTLGLSASIYGSVNFGIVQGSFNLSVSSTISFVLATGQDITLSFDASVSVSVSITIKIWFVHVTVSFSFSATVHFSETIPYGGTTLLEAAPPVRFLTAHDPRGMKRLPALRQAVAAAATPPILYLYFVPEVTVVYSSGPGTPYCDVSLGIAYDPNIPSGPFQQLAQVVASWTMESAIPSFANQGFASRADIHHLRRRLRAQRSLARTYDTIAAAPGDSGTPLNYQAIRTKLQAAFQIVIQAPPSNQEVATVPFPMFPDLQLFVSGRYNTSPDTQFVDFAAFNEQNQAYQNYVEQFFQKVGIMPPNSQNPVEEGPVSVATFVFEDYFQAMAQGVTDQIAAYLRKTRKQQFNTADLAQIDYNQLAGSLALFFRQGLQLPSATNTPTTQPLFSLTGQQFSTGYQTNIPYTLSLQQGANGGWLTITNGASTTLDPTAFTSFTGLYASNPFANPPVEGTYFSSSAQIFPFSKPTVWVNASNQSQSLYAFPKNLVQSLAQSSVGGIAVELQQRSTTDPSNPDIGPIQGNFAWAAQFDLTIRLTPSGSTNGVYQLAGFSQDQFALLDSLIAAIQAQPSGWTANLVYPNPSASGFLSVTAPATGIVTLRTNLTTETAPPTDEILLRLGDQPVIPVDADFTNLLGLLEILREYGRTNAPGYYLYCQGGLPSSIFNNTPQATVSIVLVNTPAQTPSSATVQSCFNALLLGSTGANLVYYAQALPIANLLSYSIAVDPGIFLVNLTRANPSLNSNEDQATLDSLYNLFTCQIVQSSAFQPSVALLPQGPQTLSGANSDWFYQLFVPVYRFSNSNPPSGHISPYSATGQNVTLAFDIRDCFGNSLVPYQQQTPFPVTYFDSLVNLSSWLGVSLVYTFPSANTITLTFAASTDALNGPQPGQGGQPGPLDQAVANAQLVCDQLAGPAVALSVQSSLEQSPSWHAIGSAGVAYAAGSPSIPQFALQILQYLQARQQSQQPIAPQNCIVNFTLSDPLTTQAPTEIAVSFQIARTAYVNAATAAVNPATAAVVTNAQAPVANTSDLQTFATSFASAFPSYAMATGLSTETASYFAVSNQLLAVTLTEAAQGIATYFSPRPLSNQLASGTVNVPTFDLTKGNPPTFAPYSFSNIDLDGLGRFAFRTIDSLLGPDYAAAAYLLDPAAFQSLVQDRALAAQRYSSNQLDWLFVEQQQAAGTQASNQLATAAVTFSNQLQNSLSNAYAIETVLSVPASWAAGTGAGAGDITLYGSVVQTAGTALSFASAPSKIPIVPATGGAPTTGSLEFTFALKNPSAQPFVSVNLGYAITHIVLNDSTATDSDPSWLKLVQPVTVTIGSGPTLIPIPLRQFPDPPTLISQTYDASYTGQSNPTFHLLRGWNYSYQYQYNAAGQDSVATSVTLNTPPPSAPRFRKFSTTNYLPLPAALVYFNYGYAQLAATLATLPTLTSFDPNSPAAWAIADFASLVDQLVNNTTWNGGAIQAFLGAGAGSTLPTVTNNYSVTVTPANPGPCSGLGASTCLTIDGVAGTLTGVSVLPLDPTGNPYPTAPCQSTPTSVSVVYTPPSATGWSRFAIEFDDLDILQYQNAQSTVQVLRNAALLPDSIALTPKPEFVYSSAPVQFSKPLTPYLDLSAATPADVPTLLGMASATLQQFVEALMAAALTVAGAQFPTPPVYPVRVQCAYTSALSVAGTEVYPLYPVLMTTTVPVTSATHPTPPVMTVNALADGVASQMHTFWDALQTTPVPGASFAFTLSVFAADPNSTAAVLTLPLLLLPLSAITDL